MTTEIQWDAPIEAVHPDGRVMRMELRSDCEQPDSTGDYKTTAEPDGSANEWWYSNGKSRCGSAWYIRNRVTTPTSMEFGPEIKVDGKRPEWLGSYKGPLGYSRGKYWYGPCEYEPEVWTEDDIVGGRGWDSVTAIRLPATHSHYQTTPTRTALEDRMVALCKRVADGGANIASAKDEARAILRAMEPVDNDLASAREVCALAVDEFCGHETISGEMYRAGSLDNAKPMVAALAAIRGRQLEKEGK